MTRRVTRRAFLGISAAAIGGVAGYAWGVEPGRLEVRRVHIRPASRVPRPVRILHLSDLHWSSFVSLEFIRKAIELGLREDPDVVCLTGDFVTAGDERNLEEYPPVLRPLRSAAPAFAVLGNHDGGAWSAKRGGYGTTTEISAMLGTAGIDVLDNDARTVEVNGSRIAFVGTSDLWAGGFAPFTAFGRKRIEPANARVLLAHNPDTKDSVADRNWDLMLSGHTHGGQVVIPFLGAPFANVRDRRFLDGLKPWKDRMIYTSRGVGNLYGVRFNCRPDVSILELS